MVATTKTRGGVEDVYNVLEEEEKPRAYRSHFRRFRRCLGNVYIHIYIYSVRHLTLARPHRHTQRQMTKLLFIYLFFNSSI